MLKSDRVDFHLVGIRPNPWRVETMMAGASGDTILHIEKVSKRFGPVVALKSMDLDVRRGRVHTLLGENGAGKSTLMKVLAGVLKPSGGSITFKGMPYAPKDPQDAARQGMAIIFQELSLCNNLTVGENILATQEPTRLGLISERRLYDKARGIVSDLRLPITVEQPVSQLSMARRQLVEIAKGLSHPADVVIFDEPTSSLSDSEAELLFAIIERLKAEGCAIIYISHRMEEIMRLSDDITVMRDGAYIATHRREDVTVDQLIAQMVGREMQDIYPLREVPAPTADVAPVFEVEGLSREGEFHDVSFAVRPGEILGFFGLIGSGRSEIMKSLFGRHRASGTIRLDGSEIAADSPTDAIDHRIGFVTENRKEEGLVLSHSVEWNLSAVSLDRFSGALGFLKFGRERAAAQAEADRLAIKTPDLDVHANTLSGGNQQKIVLGKWLMTKPKVLILDEPTRGVDVGAKFEIYKIIRQLAAEGTAVIMVSSELPEVLGLSDRVAVMHNGRIARILERDGLAPEQVMSHAAGVA